MRRSEVVRIIREVGHGIDTTRPEIEKLRVVEGAPIGQKVLDKLAPKRREIEAMRIGMSMACAMACALLMTDEGTTDPDALLANLYDMTIGAIIENRVEGVLEGD